MLAAQIEPTDEDLLPLAVRARDLYEDLAKRSEQRVQARGHKPKIYFGNENLYRTMLTEVKPDMVVIATPWEAHAPMGVSAMRERDSPAARRTVESVVFRTLSSSTGQAALSSFPRRILQGDSGVICRFKKCGIKESFNCDPVAFLEPRF